MQLCKCFVSHLSYSIQTIHALSKCFSCREIDTDAAALRLNLPLVENVGTIATMIGSVDVDLNFNNRNCLDHSQSPAPTRVEQIAMHLTQAYQSVARLYRGSNG